MLERFGIPRRIFPEVLPPGTFLGPLRDETGSVQATRVVVCGSHDTASAVAGTPQRGPDSAYISSGTSPLPLGDRTSRSSHWWLDPYAARRGRGVRNRLLCQMTADATNRPILAGPAEATAIGNLVVQLMAAGRIGSLAEGRSLVAQSFPVEQYVPVANPRWDDAYGRFLSMLGENAVP